MEKLQPLSSEAFAQTLGQVTWLMTMSKAHKHLPVSTIETLVSAPLVLRQVRVFSKGKQPVGALVWAYASDEVAARVEAGDTALSLPDWRSGETVLVVDCIAPFGGREDFIERFYQDVDTAKENAF